MIINIKKTEQLFKIETELIKLVILTLQVGHYINASE